MLFHLRASDYREAPWKNGGGLTYEIAADDFDPPTWRLSIARIERDGPFSDFTGYDRTIVALDGGGVELDVDGAPVHLERNVPFRFAGEAKVNATLAGDAARDLNVITARDIWLHDVEIVEAPTRFVLEEEECAFVYAIAGSVHVSEETCASGDTVLVEDRDSFDVAPAADGIACVVRITPR